MRREEEEGEGEERGSPILDFSWRLLVGVIISNNYKNILVDNFKTIS
jgi:hypothetical protein